MQRAHSQPEAALAAVGGTAGRRYLGGGTNLVDLMKLGVETPGLLVDVTAPAARPHRGGRRRRPADRRRGAQQRPGRATWRSASRYPVLAQAAAGRRLRAAAQHGHRRRQPAAAHPLPVLPGRHQAVQQAAAGSRLPGPQRRAPTTWPSSARRRSLRRHPPVRHGRRAGRLRTPWYTCRVPTATAGGAARRAVPAARRRARTGTPRSTPRRADHRRRAAARAACGRSRTARSASAPRTRSPWPRSPPRWMSPTGSCATSGSPWARSPPCRGGPPRAEQALQGRPATAEAFGRAADAELAAGRAAARQRVTRFRWQQPDRAHPGDSRRPMSTVTVTVGRPVSRVEGRPR